MWFNAKIDAKIFYKMTVFFPMNNLHAIMPKFINSCMHTYIPPYKHTGRWMWLNLLRHCIARRCQIGLDGGIFSGHNFFTPYQTLLLSCPGLGTRQWWSYRHVYQGFSYWGMGGESPGSWSLLICPLEKISPLDSPAEFSFVSTKVSFPPQQVLFLPKAKFTVPSIGGNL